MEKDKAYEVGKTMEEDKSSDFSDLVEGEFRKDEPFGSESIVHKDMDTRTVKLSSFAEVTVKRDLVIARQSMSQERGTHGGNNAKTTAEQSDYSILEDQSVHLRQPTSLRKYSEKHYQSYSPPFHLSSKERNRQRKHNCFSHKEYPDVLEKIEKVCSERFNKLISQQNGDRKEFNVLQRKQELEFFQEHIHSYKVCYERVIPTVRYERIRLPKLLFCILHGILRKHIQLQLTKFLKQIINDRNKEKRIKERWIFEAKTGCLKKYFGQTSLTYSGFEMEKPKSHAHDYSEGEHQLKYFDMRCLSSAIEAITSSNELADSHTSKNIDVSESIQENLHLPLKTNGGANYGLPVSTADENNTIDSMPSPSNCAHAVDFGEKVGTQVTFSSPPQNKGENAGGSSSVETLEIAKAMASNSGNTSPVSREKRKCMSGDDASEGSCSRSHRKMPRGLVANFPKTLCHEEPQAARLSSVDVDTREQPDDVGTENVSCDQTSSLVHVTEQQNTNANVSILTKSSTQLQHCDRTGQNDTYPHRRSDRNTRTVRIGLDSPGASNVQQQSTNQMMTRSMAEQFIPDVRLQSDATTIELNQVTMPCHDYTSSFSQATEQRNINACSSSQTQHVAQHPYRDQACQSTFEPSGGNITLLGTWLESPGESNVPQQAVNQTTTDFTYEHVIESGIQSDPFMTELSQLRMLRDLITKKHQSERQKIILDREMEEAEIKKKYNVLFHNLEMETLQKKKDIQILEQKVCKQQMLAEAFQIVQPSLAVVSCGQTGAPLRTFDVPNQSSGQQIAWFPTLATMNQPPQPAARSSTDSAHQFLRQPSMMAQEGAMSMSGRSAATLTRAPRGVVGTRTAHRAPAPHLRALVNRLPGSRHGVNT